MFLCKDFSLQQRAGIYSAVTEACLFLKQISQTSQTSCVKVIFPCRCQLKVNDVIHVNEPRNDPDSDTCEVIIGPMGQQQLGVWMSADAASVQYKRQWVSSIFSTDTKGAKRRNMFDSAWN